MCELFRVAKFNATVAKETDWSDDIQFNDSNITFYLAELEEYIGNLITFLAFTKDDPNPAIASVPLEILKVKEDKKVSNPDDIDKTRENENWDKEDTTASDVYKHVFEFHAEVGSTYYAQETS